MKSIGEVSCFQGPGSPCAPLTLEGVPKKIQCRLQEYQCNVHVLGAHNGGRLLACGKQQFVKSNFAEGASVQCGNQVTRSGRQVIMRCEGASMGRGFPCMKIPLQTQRCRGSKKRKRRIRATSFPGTNRKYSLGESETA